MNIEWLSILLGWLGGIPTALFAQWLYRRLSKRKRPKGNSWNSTFENASIRFEAEGHDRSKVYRNRILNALRGTERP